MASGFGKDIWHKDVQTLTDLYNVNPRRWGMRVTVTNAGTDSGDYVLTYNRSDTDKRNNANWLKVSDSNLPWSNPAEVFEYTSAGESVFYAPYIFNASTLLVWVNGVLQNRNNYSIINLQGVDFTTAIPAGSIVTIQAQKITEETLLSLLQNQPKNLNSDTRIKLGYAGVNQGLYFIGTWSSVATYNQYDRVVWPNASSPLVFRANANTVAGEQPTVSNKWDLDVAAEMIVNSGDDQHFFLYRLGFGQDDWIRIRQFQYGTIQNGSFLSGTPNYEGQTLAGTVAGAITVVSPGSNTSFTANTGLSLTNAVSLGSYVGNLNIPTGQPLTIEIEITPGLSINEGDQITFEGNATNFFVAVVLSYDATYGSLKCVTTMHAGTGTFGSWTLRKEQLIYVTWNAAPTTIWFYATVQTYNAGSGAITVKIVTSSGNTTQSTWTMAFGKRPAAPTTAQASRLDTVSQKFGNYFFIEFTGTEIQLAHVKDPSGTGWRGIYVSGPDSLTPPDDVIVDTYGASFTTGNFTTAFTNLKYGTHRVFFTSITSPSPASTNTGAWIYSRVNNDFSTSRINVNTQSFNSLLSVVPAGDSAGELAWAFRKAGTADTFYRLPDHNFDLTLFGRNRQFVVDNVIIDTTTINGLTNPYLYQYVPFTSFYLTQQVDIFHPDEVNIMGTLQSVHVLSKYGLLYDVLVTWLQSAELTDSYNNMLAMGQNFYQRAKASNGVYIDRPAQGTVQPLTANQIDQDQYIFYSTSQTAPQANIAVVQKWLNAAAAWRTGLPRRGISNISYFSGATGSKFYPMPFTNYIAQVNEQFRIITQLYVGNFENANQKL